MFEEDDIWDDLLDALLPDGQGSVVVLRAYVDASSREHVHPVNGDKGDLLTVAGYMFESRQRARGFCQRWKDTFGTESFSWADLVARSKPFKYLRDDRAEHDRLMAAGISIVREFTVAGTVASCRKQDVERHGPTWIKGFGHAYSIAGHMAISGLGVWARRHNYRSGIVYIVEAGDEGYDELNHWLSYSARVPQSADMYQWRGHGVTPKAPNSPFHAPDTLAWSVKCIIAIRKASWLSRPSSIRNAPAKSSVDIFGNSGGNGSCGLKAVFGTSSQRRVKLRCPRCRAASPRPASTERRTGPR